MDKMKKGKKKEKRKMAKNLTLLRGDLNPRFLNKTSKLSRPRFEFQGRLDQYRAQSSEKISTLTLYFHY